MLHQLHEQSSTLNIILHPMFRTFVSNWRCFLIQLNCLFLLCKAILLLYKFSHIILLLWLLAQLYVFYFFHLRLKSITSQFSQNVLDIALLPHHNFSIGWFLDVCCNFIIFWMLAVSKLLFWQFICIIMLCQIWLLKMALEKWLTWQMYWPLHM